MDQYRQIIFWSAEYMIYRLIFCSPNFFTKLTFPVIHMNSFEDIVKRESSLYNMSGGCDRSYLRDLSRVSFRHFHPYSLMVRCWCQWRRIAFEGHSNGNITYIDIESTCYIMDRNGRGNGDLHTTDNRRNWNCPLCAITLKLAIDLWCVDSARYVSLLPWQCHWSFPLSRVYYTMISSAPDPSYNPPLHM